MGPCCLQTVKATRHNCKIGSPRMGGASGFSATSCPKTPAEAAEWEKQSAKAKSPRAADLEVVAPVAVEDDSGSSSDFVSSFAMICFCLLILGGLAVYARNSRRGRGMPL